MLLGASARGASAGGVRGASNSGMLLHVPRTAAPAVAPAPGGASRGPVVAAPRSAAGVTAPAAVGTGPRIHGRTTAPAATALAAATHRDLDALLGGIGGSS